MGRSLPRPSRGRSHRSTEAFAKTAGVARPPAVAWSHFLSLLVVGLPHARRRDDDLTGERSNSWGHSHEDRTTGRMGASGLFDCKRRSRIRERRGTVGLLGTLDA